MALTTERERVMLKKVLLVLGALLLLLVVCGMTLLAVGSARLHGTLDASVGHDLLLPADSAAIANGGRLTRAYGCRDCHGEDLAGGLVIDQPRFMVLYGPNLTPGDGGLGHYTASDWERAIRHGIAPDGRGLVVMPSRSYAKLGDRDVAEMVAYLQTVAPVDGAPPPPTFGPASRVAALTAGDAFVPARAIDHQADHPAPVPRGPTVQYGAYLANAACSGCHGADYGGAPPGPGASLPAPNLTPRVGVGLGAWTFEDFDRAVRGGRRPDGTVIDRSMPWRAYSALTYDEVLALWRYLATVPPVDVDRTSEPS